MYVKIGLVKSTYIKDASRRGFDSHQNGSNTGSNYGIGTKYDFATNLSIRTK